MKKASSMLLLILLAFATVLVGCNGITHAPQPQQSTSPQGLYVGTGSNGSVNLTIYAMVQPDNTVSALYGTTSSSSTFALLGYISGKGQVVGKTFTANVGDYTYTGNSYGGELTATFVPNQSITGKVLETGSATKVDFDLKIVPSTAYNFDAPAQLSNVVGKWTGASMLWDMDDTITVAADGTFTGVTSGPVSCTYAGKFIPSPTNNYFTVSILFGAGSRMPDDCRVKGTLANGIGVVWNVTGGTAKKEMMMGFNSTDGYGSAFGGLQ